MIPTIVLLVKYFKKTKWVLDTVEAFSGFFFYFFFCDIFVLLVKKL